MSISIIYRVSVDIPDNIADKYHQTLEYDQIRGEATKGSNAAGSNFYAHLEEWAEFSSLKDAQQCERNLKDMIYYFAAKELKL